MTASNDLLGTRALVLMTFERLLDSVEVALSQGKPAPLTREELYLVWFLTALTQQPVASVEDAIARFPELLRAAKAQVDEATAGATTAQPPALLLPSPPAFLQ